MSFLFTMLVIWTHAMNAELFLGEAGRGGAVWTVESLLGGHLAQTAVPGFFMMSAVLFFRNYRPEDTLRKWERRLHSLVIPYFLWNLLYYLGYVIVSRAPVLRDVAGIEKVPLTLSELCGAVFLYRYNHVFWFVLQLILLVIVSPAVWFLVQRRETYFAAAAVLCTVIFLRWDPTPLNADALLYYMTAARLTVKLSPEKNARTGSRSPGGRTRNRRWAAPDRDRRLVAAGVYFCAGLILYGLHLITKNDLPLVLSRLAAAGALWTALLCVPLPRPRAIMYETFLIYAIHFGPVRFLNKCAATALPGNAAAALWLFLLMPLLILGIAWCVSRVGERYLPTLFHLFTGGR